LGDIIKGFKNQNEKTPRIVILVASGGKGKSQIALEYAKRHYEDRIYQGVFCIDACSEDTARLGLSEICDTLDPSSSTQDESSKASKALRLFESTNYKKWLLILDNYDDTELFELSLFIPKNRSGDVLITSRDRRTEKYGKVLEVPPMSDVDAIEMVRSRYQQHIGSLDGWDDAAVSSLLKELGNLPLAIEQAVSYLHCSQRSMKDFLVYYKKNSAEVLRFVPENNDFRRLSVQKGSSWISKSLSVLSTWEMSFAAVSEIGDKKSKGKNVGRQAVEILQVSAFLDRKQISVSFLEGILDPGKNILKFDWTTRSRRLQQLLDTIKILDRWCLLEGLKQTDERSESFSLHPLVQQWLVLRLSNSVRQEYLLKAIKQVEKQLERDHDQLLSTPLKEKREIVMHIDAIIRNLDDKALCSGLDLELGRGMLSLTTIRFGSFYHDMGCLDRATDLYRRILHFREGEPRWKDVRALEALEGLALVNLWEEKPEEAYEFCKEALTGNTQLHGPGHVVTLRTTHNLGEIECLRKNFGEAIRLFEECLAGFTSISGSKSKDALREKEALGNAYRASGQIGKAANLISDAQEILHKLDSTADLTLNATESLALVRKGQGRLDSAEQLYQKVIEGYERTIGPDQYTTLGALSGLADTYRKGRKWADAARLYKLIMERREKDLGLNNAGYLRTKEAYENVTSNSPDVGGADDFSYPWPRPLYAYEHHSPLFN
jgi:tetratricopeptide (TPR) repeat protein